MIVVDTHSHLLAKDLQKYPLAPIGERQTEWSKEVHMTAEEFLSHMDQAGVEHATLLQPSGSHGYDNSYCADSAMSHPKRFVGVCCIDPLAPGAADTLSYWIQERGMRGLRLFTTGTTVGETTWLDDPQTFPVWERVRSLGIPVDVQIRLTGIRMLLHLLEHFSDLPIILDHLAKPLLEDGPPYSSARELFALSVFPNLYLKFSSNNIKDASKGRSTPREFFQRLVDFFGPRRLLWGSNFPKTRGEPDAPYKELVDLANDTFSFLSQEEREWIFGKTALKLYPALRGDIKDVAA